MSKQFVPQPWVKQANLYEVNLRQYTPSGSFGEFGLHLPRLKEMGIQVLWFMPITPIGQKKRLGTLGSYYACKSYTDVNPEFGTLEQFIQLVNQAHQLGMKVIIDWVANHTAWDHVWTETNPAFYQVFEGGHFGCENGWEDVIELDYQNEGLQEAMITAMQYWIDIADIDGFRCDMAHLVPLSFWEKARTRLDNIKPCFWLAETENKEYLQVFDAFYGWAALHAMEDFWKKTVTLPELKKTFQQSLSNPEGKRSLLFTTNHDENSHNGTEFQRMGRAAICFSVLTICWPNTVPLIYSGQELPNLKSLKFFDKDPIDWNDDIQLQPFFKTLLTFRTTYQLPDMPFEIVESNEEPSIFCWQQCAKNAGYVIILNLSDNRVKIFNWTNPYGLSMFENVFSNIAYRFDKEVSFELQPWEFMLYRKI